MVAFLKQDWGERRVYGQTSKNNWFLKETKLNRIIPPLHYYLSDPTTNNQIKVRHSMINKILWIDSRMCRKSLLLSLGEGLIITKSFQEKSVRKYDAVMFNMPHLKVPFLLCFHDFSKIIFHKQKLTRRLSLKFSQNNHFVEYV